MTAPSANAILQLDSVKKYFPIRNAWKRQTCS